MRLLLYYDNPSTTARIITNVHPTTRIPWNLIINFAQLPHSIFAAASAPSKHPEVGTIKFVNPSPRLNTTPIIPATSPIT